MAAFEHYLYVLECADGSLYTGYTTDVAARVAKHNSGKGAKCTRSRLPVSLLAQARFFTKHQAMSAEYHFKQLDRDTKDQLLAKTTREPFEQVLAQELPKLTPGFAANPIQEEVAQFLAENQDPSYRDFMAALMPSVDPGRVVGVRTPALRKKAKQLAKRPDVASFMKAAPHTLFEENQLHSFIIATHKDYDQALSAIQAFLPHVDNWATCDQLPNKVLMQRPAETLERIREWIADPRIYVSRYGIETLMQYYLDERFDPEFLTLVADRRMPGFENPETASQAYYHNMMRAWFFAEAVAKQPQAAVPILTEQGGSTTLDPWTRRKAVQKSCESFRVPAQTKALLRASLPPATRASLPRSARGKKA